MQRKTVLRIIILALIIMWIIMTFNFSNQNGDESSNLSREIAEIIVSEEEKVDIIEPIIRKIAHLSEYTGGGMLFLGLFLTYDFSDKKRMLFALLVGIEYAALDETHQLFVDGRSGQVTDVLIDSIGIALGICILMLLYQMINKILGKKRKDGVLV